MSAAASASEITDTIAAFLASLGLRVEFGPVPEDTFLPGILVIGGGLRIDRARLRHPGDLLHEAGHLAVLPRGQREAPDLVIGPEPAEEIGAIAWSYAAARHLDVPLEVLFHAEGYRGGSGNLIAAFSGGSYIGAPLLDYYGLTLDPHRVRRTGDDVYPRMIRWLRE